MAVPQEEVASSLQVEIGEAFELAKRGVYGSPDASRWPAHRALLFALDEVFFMIAHRDFQAEAIEATEAFVAGLLGSPPSELHLRAFGERIVALRRQA